MVRFWLNMKLCIIYCYYNSKYMCNKDTLKKSVTIKDVLFQINAVLLNVLFIEKS